jgi:hypothetical protein
MSYEPDLPSESDWNDFSDEVTEAVFNASEEPIWSSPRLLDIAVMMTMFAALCAITVLCGMGVEDSTGFRFAVASLSILGSSSISDLQQREIVACRPETLPSCLVVANRDEASYPGSSSIVPLLCSDSPMRVRHAVSMVLASQEACGVGTSAVSVWGSLSLDHQPPPKTEL